MPIIKLDCNDKASLEGFLKSAIRYDTDNDCYLMAVTGISGGSTGGGGDSSSVNQLLMLDEAKKENFTKTVGNSVEYTYFTFLATENPSGNKNLRRAIYKTGATTIFTVDYEYDLGDYIVKQTIT